MHINIHTYMVAITTVIHKPQSLFPCLQHFLVTALQTKCSLFLWTLANQQPVLVHEIHVPEMWVLLCARQCCTQHCICVSCDHFMQKLYNYVCSLSWIWLVICNGRDSMVLLTFWMLRQAFGNQKVHRFTVGIVSVAAITSLLYLHSSHVFLWTLMEQAWYIIPLQPSMNKLAMYNLSRLTASLLHVVLHAYLCTLIRHGGLKACPQSRTTRIQRYLCEKLVHFMINVAVSLQQ